MDKLNLEQRRCERLRNLLTPFYLLPQFIQNSDSEIDQSIKDIANRAMSNWPLIEKALDPNALLEELEKLYNEPVDTK